MYTFNAKVDVKFIPLQTFHPLTVSGNCRVNRTRRQSFSCGLLIMPHHGPLFIFLCAPPCSRRHGLHQFLPAKRLLELCFTNPKSHHSSVRDSIVTEKVNEPHIDPLLLNTISIVWGPVYYATEYRMLVSLHFGVTEVCGNDQHRLEQYGLG